MAFIVQPSQQNTLWVLPIHSSFPHAYLKIDRTGKPHAKLALKLPTEGVNGVPI